MKPKPRKQIIKNAIKGQPRYGGSTGGRPGKKPSVVPYSSNPNYEANGPLVGGPSLGTQMRNYRKHRGAPKSAYR